MPVLLGTEGADAHEEAGPQTGAGGARTRLHPEGREGLGTKEAAYIARHNELVRRAVVILEAVVEAGGEIVIENPADRGDPATHLFRWRWRSHTPLWLMPDVWFG